jgi:hypothetical protein
MIPFLSYETVNVSESVADDIIKKLKMMIQKECTFFGPQPISIERKHIPIVKQNEYYISYKADGERYCFVVMNYENKNLCMFINRKLEIFPLKLHMSREFFKGTVIDGEIIFHEDKYYFLGFDCLMLSGKNVMNFHFNERIKHIDCVSNCLNSTKYCEFQTKLFVKLDDFKKLEFKFKNDGYVFMPVQCPITFGTHNSFFKLKDRLDNTVDFRISKNKLCLIKNKTITKTMNKIDYTFVSKESIIEDGIYECKYIDDKLWAPLHIRSDKMDPNSYYVYQRTLVNIKENMNIYELIE